MKVTGNACHIIGTEGSSPPLPYVEVSDTEGRVLIGLGHAVEVTDVDDAPEPAPKKKAESKAPPASKEPETPPPPAAEPNKVDEDRATLIADALDLVEGDPTVEAVADITGLADVTAEEIAAAVAAKDAAA